MGTDTFFNILYQRCTRGEVEFRFVPPNKDSKNPVIQKFISLSNFSPPLYPAGKNIYFGVATRDGKGGGKENLVEIPALWVDLDLKNTSIETIPERYRDFPLKPSIAVETGGGYHLYWVLRKPSTKEEVPRIENYLDRLASFWGGDQGATDASRILRVPGTLNVKPEYDPPRRVVIMKLDSSLEYALSDFDFLPEMQTRAEVASTAQLLPGWQDGLLEGVPAGERNVRATQLAGRLFGMGHSEQEVLFFLSSWNQRNVPPLEDKEIAAVVKSIGDTHKRKHPGNGKHLLRTPPSWPPPLAQEAFHGLAGDFVKIIEPQTEADPVALLIQFLTVTGNIVGSKPHFRVEADTHYLKIFSVLVGESAKGRKGTSWNHIKNIFGQIDQPWREKRIMSGLSSGEGLIWQVRDEIIKREPLREKGRFTGEYQEYVDDQGEEDKRLLVIEPEFAGTLRVIGRDGNILSPIIRQAWDDGNLRVLTKTSPAKSTGAHVSIIGHITRDELKRYLDRTEIGNGFANRFIWVCVKRSKSLPEGGQTVDLAPIEKGIKEVIEFGRGAGEITKDSQATELWAEVYPELSEGKPGLFGAVTSRAEAQVMRLACLYAVLDISPKVRQEHLLAALAIWDYSEASAKYIFGDSTGDPIADRIYQAIKNSPSGLSLSEMHDLFQRNENKGKIQSALNLLERFGGVQRISRNTGGRPVEVWRVSEKTK